ncbi:formylglycine-generating enzyme family protein, partial [bacterium]|nr:formylglycine-generating enzyme family protein [bacterium]
SDLMVNIINADGDVQPIFENLTDIALDLGISSEQTAANIAIPLLDEIINFPNELYMSVDVYRKSMSRNGGILIFTLVNGWQDLAVVRNIGEISDDKAMPEKIVIGGNYTFRNPNFPILAVIQNGMPSLGSEIVINNVKGFQNGIINTPTPTLTPTPTPLAEQLTINLDISPDRKEMEFIWVNAGSFYMGSNIDDFNSQESEYPLHEVIIDKGFYISKYEITNAQFVAFLRGIGRKSDKIKDVEYLDYDNQFSQIELIGVSSSGYDWNIENRKEDFPAQLITWYGANEFCNWLSDSIIDYTPRLPTEAEWEYACRAGTQTIFSHGEILSCEEEQCEPCEFHDPFMWWCGNTSNPQKVGTKLPNPWGIFDMHGNVMEWCGDWSSSYSSVIQISPVGPIDGRNRVLRGGSGSLSSCRSANRSASAPETASPRIGFRVVLSPDFEINY